MSAGSEQRLSKPGLPGFRGNLPGIAVSILVALAAAYLAERLSGPILLLALLLGAAVRLVAEPQQISPGLGLCSGPLLRVGVALLGLKIVGAQLVSLGWPVLAMIAVCVALTIGLGVLLGRSSRMGGALGALVGGATAICGASAALALSAVLPLGPDRERATSAVVVAVSILSTIAMILYPVLAKALHLSPLQAGVFLGASIHDVAQVMGAGYSISETTGDTAALIKMVRVALLGPAVVVIGLILSRRGAELGGLPRIPLFVVAFFGLAALRSMELIPPVALKLGGQASLALMVLATAALGLRLDVLELRRTGGTVAVLGLACTFFLAALALGVAALATPGK